MTPEQKIEALQAELTNAKDFIWYMRSFLTDDTDAFATRADRSAIAIYTRIDNLLKQTGAPQ